MTPVEFLLARVGELEAKAQAATPGPWRWADASDTIREDRQFGRCIAGVALTVKDGPHIAAWDPQMALAWCTAMREMLKLHVPYHRPIGLGCENCLADRTKHAFFPGWPCPTVRALLGMFADHPDFDPAWRLED